jgi:hypothetical protein
MYYNYYFFVKILYLLTLYTKGFNIYVYYFNLKWRKYVKQKNFKNIFIIYYADTYFASCIGTDYIYQLQIVF